MSFLTRTGKMSYAGGKIKAGKGNLFTNPQKRPEPNNPGERYQ